MCVTATDGGYKAWRPCGGGAPPTAVNWAVGGSSLVAGALHSADSFCSGHCGAGGRWTALRTALLARRVRCLTCHPAPLSLSSLQTSPCPSPMPRREGGAPAPQRRQQQQQQPPPPPCTAAASSRRPGPQLARPPPRGAPALHSAVLPILYCAPPSGSLSNLARLSRGLGSPSQEQTTSPDSLLTNCAVLTVSTVQADQVVKAQKYS